MIEQSPLSAKADHGEKEESLFSSAPSRCFDDEDGKEPDDYQISTASFPLHTIPDG